ncbi:hypothetical protein WK55_21995 [Burkholderia ubonensis]|nr:hypothetical protein WK55_21995 [Burkholderia ubonensis]
MAERYLRLTAETLENTNARRIGAEHIWTTLLITKYHLDEYFEANGIMKTAKGISRGLTEVQMLCKLTVHIYSGMRDQEASSLPYYCTETEEWSGRKHYILCGATTKLNKGKIRRTRWVTSFESFAAIEIAQRIAALIYQSMGHTPEKSAGRINRYPLFVSTGYLALNGRPPATRTEIFQTQWLRTSQRGHSLLNEALRPIIEEQDLRELEDIDPHRPWRSEAGMQVGQPWRLTTHQFRRSLALYAQRSGLVSLPSLKRQLQHITLEMSNYYARGAIFARNFIEDSPSGYNEHIAKEWRETRPESEALAYLRDVLFSGDELFGGAGAFEQQKKDRGVIADRGATLRQFKRGVIAYREIPVGGCIKVGECDQVGLRMLGTGCLNGCKNLVGKLPRLERVIERQTGLVASLDPSSVEFRMEQSDLDVLVATRDQWLAMSKRRHRAKRPN